MPATNKLLFEAGYTPFRYKPIFGHPPPDGITNLIPVTEQSNAINPADRTPCTRRVANYRYRARRDLGAGAAARPTTCMASASYVTGAHSVKVGYQCTGWTCSTRTSPTRTQLGVPLQPGRAERGELLAAGLRPPHDHHRQQRLRPGQLDARPADAAGRAALRPRLELRAGPNERHDRTRRS